jgi:hypothetical protein
MYVVQCPKCHATLRLAQPVENRKIRCSKCGVAFVGSTQVIGESAASGSSGPSLEAAAMGRQHARRPVRRHVKSATPNWAVPVAIAALVGIVVVALVLGHYAGTVVVEVPDGAGGFVQMRVSKEEAARIQREREEMQKKVTAAGPVARSPAESPQPAPRPRPAELEAPQNPDQQPRPITPVSPEVAIRDAKTLPGSDEAVDVSLDRMVYGMDATIGHMVGTIHNTEDKPLEQVSVEVVVRDSAGRERTLQGQVRHVAGNSLLPISFPYRGIDPEQVASVSMRATTTAMGRDMVIEPVAEEFTSFEVAGQLVRVKGRVVRGRNARSLRNVKVVGDFYRDDGVWIGRGETALDGRSGLGAGDVGFFTLEMNPTKSGFLAASVRDYELRMVASE